ncbi:uncharacterized protein LOC109834089 [Asparagus officinalis]|uniref:uncharacterized protein LOC109834089 n=1 Tax=Asparagus officinalis TaxID=4686 RepID=UPI00098E8230|nr:uncharacterized protein LOC109834089 [Asparagus officinalis]
MDEKIEKKSTESGSLFRSLIQTQIKENVSSGNHNFSSQLEGKSLKNKVDAKEGGTFFSNEYVRDHGSLLSLHPWIFKKEVYQDEENMMKVNGDLCDRCSHELKMSTYSLPAGLSLRNVSVGYGQGRGRSSLKSRRSHRRSVKSVASLGNCLIPQLYNEHFELEEYFVSSMPSSTVTTLRPLIITDGNRTISKSTYDTMGMQYESGLLKEVDGIASQQMETVVGVPPLPKFISSKQTSREAQHRNSPRTCKVSHSQDSSRRMLLFCLGINVGLISTIISNKREIETLNSMLKHSENLVQDLQEELDMKDSLTVKELHNEAFESQRLDSNHANIEDSINLLQTEAPASWFSENTDDSVNPHLSKSVEISELSRIEAELEAELERLELNINASSLERQMSALSELDPDFIADVVHGELRVDMLDDGTQEGNRDSHSSFTTETHNVNYAVSPRELSLRLHEVIQCRLEERIKELESALHHSQKQLEFMRSEQVFEMTSYSDVESPTRYDQGDILVEPLHLDLAGDALAAYGEAYEEFIKASEERIDNGSSVGESRDFRSREYNDVVESSESDDEEGKVLIQRILERTKKGYPDVVMHA